MKGIQNCSSLKRLQLRNNLDMTQADLPGEQNSDSLQLEKEWVIKNGLLDYILESWCLECCA